MKTNGSQNSRFTGRHMLGIMLGFFGVIIAVNVTMAVVANTSWSGFVVRNSYIAGLEFNERAEAARAQNALGWTSDLSVADGAVRFSLADEQGRAVELEGGTLTLRRPVNDTEDRTVEMTPMAGGALSAAVVLGDGNWIAEVRAQAGLEAPWHQIERIHVRGGLAR